MNPKKLADIFLSHDGLVSDKWEHYLPVYDAALAARVAEDRPLRLLEIGVQNGGSLQIWSEFLPAGSTILGIDIDPACAALSIQGATVIIGDATDPSFLHAALNDALFDIIIDDGSHNSPDVVATFEACFRHLAPGGIYFIEDLHASYWNSYGGGFRRATSAIEWLKGIVDAVNADHFESDAETNAPGVDVGSLRDIGRQIVGVFFFDSLAAIVKLDELRQEPYRRVLTGKQAPVFDLASHIPTLPLPQVRSLQLSSSAITSFAPALLESLAEAIERAVAGTNAQNRVSNLEAEIADLSEKLAFSQTRASEVTAALADLQKDFQVRVAELLQVSEKLIVAETNAALAVADLDEQRKYSAIRVADLEVNVARLSEKLASSEALVSWATAAAATAERRLTSSRYLFPAIWKKIRNTPRDLGRKLRGVRLDAAGLVVRRGKVRPTELLARALSRAFFPPRESVPASDFDARWYLETYSDVRFAGMDPWRHYVKHGRAEGRLPKPSFGRREQGTLTRPANSADGLVRNPGAAADFDLILHSLAHPVALDGRPTILILPGVFAIGGVERNTNGNVMSLSREYRYLGVPNEEHTASGGCLLSEIAPYVAATIDLERLADRASHLALLQSVFSASPPDLLWLCNGSLWLHQNMDALLNLFRDVPIVNQEIYDDRAGWINHIDQNIARSHDRFIAVNQRIASRLASTFNIAAKVDLIYMAVDLDRLGPIRAERFGAERNYALIARLSEQKRPLEYIRLAAMVSKHRPSVKFHLYGDGPLASECEALIRHLGAGSNVTMHGFVDEVGLVLQATDGLVFTSEYEGLPSAMLEALGSGVPVFATDTGDIVMVAERFGGCFVVPVEYTADDLLPAFLEFDANIVEFSQRAREIAHEIRATFSTKAIVGQYRLCFQTAWQTRADADISE